MTNGPEPGGGEPAAPVAELAPGAEEPAGAAAAGEEDEGVVELVRRILLRLVQSVEDGADLLGATLREELEGFRVEVERRVIALVLLFAGGGLLTAGLVVLLREWLGGWAPGLLLAGLVYGAVGLVLLRTRPRADR